MWDGDFMEKELEKLIAENYEFADYFFSELKENYELLIMGGETLSKEQMENIIDMSLGSQDYSRDQVRIIKMLKEKWMSYIESGSGVSDGFDKVMRYISELRTRYFGEKT